MSSTSLESIYNFVLISLRIATAGQPSEEELRSVANAGFETVINLALHDDPRYALPEETGLVQSLGMEYIHLPVLFTGPTESDLFAFFKAYELRHNKKIFIHCAANKRVSVFLALYRILKEGWPQNQALSEIRTVWEPDEIWQAFVSTVLEKYVRRGGSDL